MATWDNADLLARCKRYARRPTTDESYGDPDWYASMTEAQADAISDLASRVPDALVSAPVLLTSSDGGKTYGFGTDVDGDSVDPMGHAEIYPNLKSIPHAPLVPGIDFLIEGDNIRIPADKTKSWSGGPYARFVSRPTKIDGSTQPTLRPKPARLMIVFGAVARWAARPGSGADPSYWEKQYEAAFTRILTDLRSQFNLASTQARGVLLQPWWRRVNA
jgi:hypothetical protein